MAHECEDEHGKAVKTSVCLEEKMLEEPEEAARGLAEDTGRRWSGGKTV